jgi:hypothetical protein
MRKALYATAVMNFLAAPGFLPGAEALRELAGLPAGGHPLYLAMAALFVTLFAVGYLWCALANRADPIFITLSAAGKIGFVALVAWFWTAGQVPFRAVVVASPDLVFGLIFLTWLLGSPRPVLAPDLSSSRARG